MAFTCKKCGNVLSEDKKCLECAMINMTIDEQTERTCKICKRKFIGPHCEPCQTGATERLAHGLSERRIDCMAVKVQEMVASTKAKRGIFIAMGDSLEEASRLKDTYKVAFYDSENFALLGIGECPELETYDPTCEAIVASNIMNGDLQPWFGYKVITFSEAKKMAKKITDVDIKSTSDIDICNICGAFANKTCRRCKAKKYCSVECQKQDWPFHKTKCQKKDLPSSSPSRMHSGK